MILGRMKIKKRLSRDQRSDFTTSVGWVRYKIKLQKIKKIAEIQYKLLNYNEKGSLKE